MQPKCTSGVYRALYSAIEKAYSFHVHMEHGTFTSIHHKKKKKKKKFKEKKITDPVLVRSKFLNKILANPIQQYKNY